MGLSSTFLARQELRLLQFSPSSAVPGGNVVQRLRVTGAARDTPKWKSQWSRGASPGEYGGPPKSLDPRKPREQLDLYSGKGGFIWSKNWRKQLDDELVRATQAEKAAAEKAAAEKKEADSGFLSMSRTFALDSMETDLSKELVGPSQATLERQVEAARRDAEFDALRFEQEERERKGVIKWRFAPTRKEEKYWQKGKEAAVKLDKKKAGVTRSAEERAEQGVRDLAKYEEMKLRLFLLTAGTGVALTASTYFAYSPEISLSYAVGLLGGLVYLRMLSSSVDSIGEAGLGSAVRGAAGQPRLLVPLVLVMGFNRWNELLVPQFDAVPLQLIPMLLGFVTYKMATVLQTIQEALPQEAEPES